MRRSKLVTQKQISILAVDDDPIITDTIQDYFKRSGYHVETENNPQAAVERVRQGKFDIMLLDFLMSPICGDQVVEEIREFNRDLFIVLLTGHKSMAPPVKTIRQLDIQGYYEKDDRFDQLELLVESCVKSIKQMRTIREFEADLSAVVDDLPEIYQLQDAGSIANGILSMAMKVMPFSQGFVRLEKSTEVKWFFYGDNALQNAAKDAFAQVQGNSWQTTVQAGWYMFRLVDEGQNAVGCMGFVPENQPSREKIQLLCILARQASAAIANSDLHSYVNEQNEKLSEAYMQTIETLRYVVETRDKETKGHSERVSELAAGLAVEMGMDKAEVDMIRVAGMFHDIGKIGVPDAILLKNGPLTDGEYGEIKKHPAEGEKILATYTPLKDILSIIRSHHERFDGRGYPDRLAGEEICIGARVIAVADSFDAMISNRTYRSGLGFEKTMQELEKGKGTQFDPTIVEVMMRLIERIGRSRFEEKYCAHTCTTKL